MVNGFTVAGVAAGVVVVGGGIFALTSFEKVDNGNVGVRYSMNGGVRDQAVGQGLHYIGLDSLTQYPIRTQTVSDNVSLATEDGKKTTVKITYSYHVNPTDAVKIYKKFGSADIETIEKGWLQQKLQKAGRDTLSKYTLLEVAGADAGKVQGSILTGFSKDVEKQGFVVEDLSFGTPSIDAQTQASIDGLIKAGQDNKKAELEAKSKQIAAEADAKAKVTAAEAEAKANEVINNSITDKTIDYMTANAHLKHGFITVSGANSVITDGTK